MSSAQKITASHVSRNAYLYVRQSTLRQVFENTESTQRQYALRDRAVALGWPIERVIVIDDDQGQSGATAVDRLGFQRLVSEVGTGRAGIVLGLEVSRLARNSSDWHRLLEICALADTLILDEDGLYDPKEFNDRLLLGLKGAMSEAELHVLRSRLRGGIINKALRAALKSRLPVGLVYDADTRVRLDPDSQVQAAVRTLFGTFRRAGSAHGTVREFRKEKLLFPRRMYKGTMKGQLVWKPLDCPMVLHTLHNVRYAGAFFWGRGRSWKLPDGTRKYELLPQDKWVSLVKGVHEGYISWEDFEENERRLEETAQAHGKDRRKSPPREGPALIQGLVLCGICGDRMTVCYRSNRSKVRKGIEPQYRCQRRLINVDDPLCQAIAGSSIDKAIGEILVEMVTPVALEVALTVQHEVQSRIEEADRLRQKQVQRARYEADLARQRFMQVDPNNRLVADALEADWNDRLRGLQQAQEEYDRKRQADRAVIGDEQRAQIRAIATDFRRLWHDPKTPQRERKRMARLLIEDVTLVKGKEQVAVHIRFRGGETRSLSVPIPPPAWKVRQTPDNVVAKIDRLLEDHIDSEIAAILNKEGMLSGERRPFGRITVWRIRRDYSLKSRYRRLRARGMLTQVEIGKKLNVLPPTIRRWRSAGLLKAHAYSERNEYLYEPPGKDAPAKGKWKIRRRACGKSTDRGQNTASRCERSAV
jgi:DNA invertase Pin-like site-specific DNA recombinase